MRLKTERLVLREVEKKDLNNLVNDMNNIKISSCMLGVPNPFTRKDGIEWIKHCETERKEKPREEYIFAITLKNEDIMIGEVILSETDHDQKTANLVYWLSESHWRKGIVEEAVQAVLRFAFLDLNLRRLEISAFKENIPSNKMAKKLGFKFEGTKRSASVPEATGKIHDDNYYSLLKDEYLNKTRKRIRIFNHKIFLKLLKNKK